MYRQWQETSNLADATLTCREVIELLALETQCLLIPEQVCVVQRCLVHELQSLCDQKHGKDDQINFPPESLHLELNHQGGTRQT